MHRLVGTLEYAGLVLREPGSRRLQLGSRLERFSIATLMNCPGRTERHAILSAVVESTGETCNLTALAGTDIVYLDRVETSWPLRMMLAPGSHVPLHATSSGKLLASLLPKPQRDRLIRHLTLRAFTENTIIDRDALEAEMRETSRRRIGVNRAEHLRGMSGVAVPVMIDRQRACAAVAIQAPGGPDDARGTAGPRAAAARGGGCHRRDLRPRGGARLGERRHHLAREVAHAFQWRDGLDDDVLDPRGLVASDALDAASGGPQRFSSSTSCGVGGTAKRCSRSLA